MVAPRTAAYGATATLKAIVGNGRNRRAKPSFAKMRPDDRVAPIAGIRGTKNARVCQDPDVAYGLIQLVVVTT